MRMIDARLIETGRIGVMLVLLVLSAYFVARLAWLIVAPGDAVSSLTPRPLPSPVGTLASSEVRADISLLVTTNPFQAGEPGDATIVDAPETDLNLKLVALFMSTGADAPSSATIITPDNRAERYEPGETILPGVVLERVMSDRAIISREGREETIMRSGRSAGLSVIGDPATAAPDTGEVQTESTPLYQPGISARTLMAGIDAEPDMQNDTISALIIRPRGDGSLLESAGLEPGDRLVSVNGRAVQDIDIPALASQLQAGGTSRLDIVRAGEAISLDIRFEEE